MKTVPTRFWDFIRAVPLEFMAAAAVAYFWQYLLPLPLRGEGFMVFLIAMLLVVFAALRSMLLSATERSLLAAEAELKRVKDERPVDPWIYQHTLMKMSGQELPEWGPTLTKTSLLYGALILEEAGETMNAISNILAKDNDVYWLSTSYGKIGSKLEWEAKTLRNKISHLPADHRGWAVSKEQGIELLDGVTDIMVVTSGLTEACALPGAAAYKETVTSNMSKANPKTGVIEKDESGKWIKGVVYRKPRLDLIMDELITTGSVK
jgi:hypothetical protein